MDYIEISLKISFYCTKKIFHVVGRIGMLGSTGLGTHGCSVILIYFPNRHCPLFSTGFSELLSAQALCSTVCATLLQSCPNLCELTDCNLPGSSVHGILQARIISPTLQLLFLSHLLLQRLQTCHSGLPSNFCLPSFTFPWSFTHCLLLPSAILVLFPSTCLWSRSHHLLLT